ncbi:patched domain-containing protein 2-like protein [Lates japonicus]|uniref:Patched domain-containing protein 2-like protein n=1 Tax=Lates japonicus TaxID=270547 RepID=A0AAD3RP58_LATJO|nr:patched domain-containing protein 2-like protein [Lates japonicus]
MQHPQFHQSCWKPELRICHTGTGPTAPHPAHSPVLSLTPAREEDILRIYPIHDIQGSLSLAITHPQFYWYVDESLSPSTPPPLPQ